MDKQINLLHLKKDEDLLNSLIEYLGIESVDDVSALDFFKQTIEQVYEDRVSARAKRQIKLMKGAK